MLQIAIEVGHVCAGDNVYMHGLGPTPLRQDEARPDGISVMAMFPLQLTLKKKIVYQKNKQ